MYDTDGQDAWENMPMDDKKVVAPMRFQAHVHVDVRYRTNPTIRPGISWKDDLTGREVPEVTDVQQAWDYLENYQPDWSKYADNADAVKVTIWVNRRQGMDERIAYGTLSRMFERYPKEV